MKTLLLVVNKSEQRKVICNHLRLISLYRVQTVFKLSPSLFSQPCRFRRAVKSASFPPGEAKRAGTNSPWCIPIGVLRTAADPSGAMRRLPFQGRLGEWGNVMFWFHYPVPFNEPRRFRRVSGRCGHRPLREDRGCDSFNRAWMWTDLAGRCGHRPLQA